MNFYCGPHLASWKALFILAASLHAQPALAQHKPYEPLPVTYDTSAAADADLRALIETLRGAVSRQDLASVDAELAPSLIVYECDADPAKACPEVTAAPAAPVKITGVAKPVKVSKTASAKAEARLAALAKLAPAQRLRTGLCCRDVPVQHITRAMREEAVLGFIGAALEEETPGAHPDLAGAICLPAWPAFDRARAAQIAVNADIENANLRVATTDLTLREKPAKDAVEAAKIRKGDAVAFVSDAADSLPDSWSAIALPAGGVGYTDQGGLADLTPAGLCFVRDAAGNWKISAAIQRHS